jgi:hypothetical protein
MNGSKTKKFIELWTNQKQARDSALVQSKGTKTIFTLILQELYSIEFYILKYFIGGKIRWYEGQRYSLVFNFTIVFT